jgi:hypothetical protein
MVSFVRQYAGPKRSHGARNSREFLHRNETVERLQSTKSSRRATSQRLILAPLAKKIHPKPCRNLFMRHKASNHKGIAKQKSPAGLENTKEIRKHLRPVLDMTENDVRVNGVKRVAVLRQRLCYIKLLKPGFCPDLCLFSEDIGISDTLCIDIKSKHSAPGTFRQMNCVAPATATYFQH